MLEQNCGDLWQCGLWMCYLCSVVWQAFDAVMTHKKKELAEKPRWAMCPTGDSNEKTMSWTKSLSQPLFQKIPFVITLYFETYIHTINYAQFWSCTNIFKYFCDSYSFLIGLEIFVSSLEKIDNANQTEMIIKCSVCLYCKCSNCTLWKFECLELMHIHINIFLSYFVLIPNCI